SKVVPGMGSISLAEGGKITQGTGPKSDDVLARVSKNETVVSAAHSKVLAPVFSAIGVPGYASGGIPGSGIVKKVVKDVKGAISDLDPAKLLDAALNFSGISGPDAKILENIPTTVVHDMVGAATKLLAKAVTALAGSGGGGGGGAGGTGKYTGSYGAGVAQWASDVAAVLKMLGLPQSLAGQVLYQMSTESGGNPNAINLTDSNAMAGDPSRGLLQT